MKYLDFGGRQASAIGLGVWQFGSEEWGWGRDFDQTRANRIVDRALQAGINFFDTAELYGHGRSEEILGQALAGRREQALIATKVTPTHLTHDGVVAAAKRSLSRLGVEAADLYQVHWPNRFVRMRSTMSGMRELLERGLIKQCGVSNYPLRLWQRAERELGRPVISNQVHLHLLDQTAVDSLLPYARAQGRVIIAYSPLAQGVLGGRYDPEELPTDFRASNPAFSRSNFERIAPVLDKLRSVARAHQATPAQIALAWLIHLPNVIAIPGARSVEQVETNAAAADIDLSQDEWDGLAEVAREVQPRRARNGWKRLAARIFGAL
jgi:aryl-alcohol dehydrogenase-like predicted oxidoreductase